MRRAPLLVLGAVTALVTVASVASCTTDDPAQRQAETLVGFGGPHGWTAVAQGGEKLADDERAGTVGDVPVVYIEGDQPAGVQVRWSAPVDDSDLADRCGELARWLVSAAQAWPSGTAVDADGVQADCEQRSAQVGGAVVASGAGEAHDEGGRVTYAAGSTTGADGHEELVATLAFDSDSRS
ncbi:hypothetical protein [Cellulomonas sp. HZM]|uniref:hypothetical protein n=1 Tax=Cellulomonas sp. HZM TaxID=1454010 RepID=UPI0004932F36|nr:hypothetical protein [Cellulomonas sp. HZM]